LTLVLDALKGAAAVLVVSWILEVALFSEQIYSRLTGPYWWVVAAGVAVIIGHMFPVWLGFRGGKGVATGVGVFLMLAPIAVAFAGVVFLVIVWRSRYVSLGSIVAAALIPLFVWLQDGLIRPVAHLIPTMSAAAAGAILIIFAHRANIRRLVEGTENKLK
jgi:glycerol-3-phosphate acyltransferase PlsY